MKTCRQLFQSSLNHVNMPQCQNIGTKGFEFLPWPLELRISFVLMHLHAFVWQALLQATGNSGGKPGEKLWWSRLSHLHISCWSLHAWCLSPMLRPMFKDQHIEKLLNRNISEIGATLLQFDKWFYIFFLLSPSLPLCLSQHVSTTGVLFTACTCLTFLLNVFKCFIQIHARVDTVSHLLHWYSSTTLFQMFPQIVCIKNFHFSNYMSVKLLIFSLTIRFCSTCVLKANA